MDHDSAEKDATKEPRSSKTSRKATKRAPQQKQYSERQCELSRTAHKRQRGKKTSEPHGDKRPKEISDNRDQASSQAGTHEAHSEGPNVRSPGHHSAARNEEDSRLSQLHADRRFDPASQSEPLSLTEIESAKMPPSNEGQAQLPKAGHDLGANPRNVTHDVIVTASEDVKGLDREAQHTTRTIPKSSCFQYGADIERAVKPRHSSEQPKARSLTAQKPPAVHPPEDGIKPSGFGVMSPEVSKRPKYIQYSARISIVLLTIIVTAFSALRRHSQERHYDICDTLACYAYSERLRESINASVNPCDSFTHYVCDGWSSRNEISVNDDALLSSLARMSQMVRDMKVPKSGQNLMQRAAAFYRSCERIGKGDSNQLTDVVLALKAANVVWPLNAHRPDFLQTLLHLSIKLRWPSILAFNVLATPSKTRLIQRPANEFYMLHQRANEQLHSPGSRQRYFNTLKKIFVAASGPGNPDDLVTFEETRKAEENILDELWPGSGVHTLLNIDAEFEFFVPKSLALQWKETLVEYCLGTQNNTDIELVTDSYAFIFIFFDLWVKYGDDQMHLLLSWCTVQVAALLANQALLVNFYGTNQKVELGHAAFCFSKTFVATGDALLYRFSETTLPGSLRQEARALILDVRQSLQRQILSWEYRDDNMTVVHDWDSTSVVLQYFEKPVQDDDGEPEAIDVLEGGAVDMGDSLVANWQKASNASFLNPSSRYLSKVMQDMGLYLVHADTLQPDFSLLPYAFGFPYYDHGATRALNYAGIGSRVAEALIMLFTSVYIFSQRTGGAIAAHAQCMANVSSSEISISKLAQYFEPLSLKTALYAYRARKDTKNQRLRGLEFLTPEQLFFVAACYVRCVRTSGHSGAADELCDVPFREVAEFSDAFACALGSRMNPSQRCELF